MKELARAKEQVTKAMDALDKPNPDHDTVGQRLSAAMAMVAVVRSEAWQEERERQVAKTVKAIESSEKKIKILPEQKNEHEKASVLAEA